MLVPVLVLVFGPRLEDEYGVGCLTYRLAESLSVLHKSTGAAQYGSRRTSISTIWRLLFLTHLGN